MIKVRFLLALSYRFEVFITISTRLILLFASVFFWKTAFAGIDEVAEVNQEQMLVYSIMAIVLAVVNTFFIEDKIREKIRRGNVALDFIKPVNVFLMYFMEDVGDSLTAFVQRAIPILICAALFVTIPKPYSLIHFLLFLLSACISFLLLWLLSALFALLYFKYIDFGPLSNVKNYLITILSGSLIPVWFFPESVQKILEFLPFIYIYQLPLGIFIGRENISGALTGIGIQAFWCALAAFLFNYCRRRVIKTIIAQGG